MAPRPPGLFALPVRFADLGELGPGDLDLLRLGEGVSTPLKNEGLGGLPYFAMCHLM